MENTLRAEQARVLDAAHWGANAHLELQAAYLDEAGEFPRASLLALGERGLLGVNVPKTYGGQDAGALGYSFAVRTLAQACAGTTVAMMVTNMVAEAIVKFGSDAQCERYVRAICSGEYAAASFSLSEPGSGSDAASLRTTARREGDHYVLNGTKAWVTSGGHAGVYLVMASTDSHLKARGISSFLIEPNTPGFTVTKPEKKMGLRCSTTTQLVFEDCVVPQEARLGDEGIGFRVAMNALDGGRIGVSAQACGIAEAALNRIKTAARDHLASGQKLSADCYGLLGELESRWHAAWALCVRAAQLKDAEKSVTKEAAMSKFVCTEMAQSVCEGALKLAARLGVGDTADLERYLRDVRVTRIYEGTSEVQRIVVAREVLKQAGTAGRGGLG